jgi:hypothetical protein
LIGSKFLDKEHDNPIIEFMRKDYKYGPASVLCIPILLIGGYLHWLGMQLFLNN